MATTFLNIMFQADVSRYEDEEFDEFAERNCGERPEIKEKAIKELRRLIIERGQCNPRRMDDAYLLRFLRCRRFIPPLAHILMVRYEEFRKTYPSLYRCDAFGMPKVKDVCAEMVPDTPEHGRIVLTRIGQWECDKVKPIDLMRHVLLIDEIMVMSPKLQILGVTIIIDLEGVTYRHMSHMTTTIAHQFVSLTGVSFPIHIHSVHVVKYGWLLNTSFNIFKPFIPEAAWKKLFFHGYDMTSLHKHIDPEYLPPEYGGTNECMITSDEWLSKIDRYKDDFLVQELRDLGYTVGKSKFVVDEMWDMD